VTQALLELAPRPHDADAMYDVFVEWAADRGFSLYPAQDEAIIEIVSGANVVLSTPTGTGKSLVAVAAHAASVARTAEREVLPARRDLRRAERRHGHR
jgi:superfamily II RNA helicase